MLFLVAKYQNVLNDRKDPGFEMIEAKDALEATEKYRCENNETLVVVPYEPIIFDVTIIYRAR